MKKILFILVCLMMVGINGVKAQNAKIMLHHNGTPTFFYSSETQAALDAAEEGDTIYFNEGSFQGGITISKKVVIIGYGDEKSVIGGNVSIAIGEGGETLTKPLLNGMTVRGNISIDKAVKGLVITKSSFENIYFNEDVDESNIDRCWIYGYNDGAGVRLSEHTKGVIINNSKILRVSGDAHSASGAVFSNCNIRRMYFYWGGNGLKRGTYRNCIIENMESGGSYYDVTTTYINCLNPDSGWWKGEVHDCWTTTGDLLDDDTAVCLQTDEQLVSAGYVGTDGKVVGINGGETPYTLTTNAPKITDFSTAVDSETLKVTVNLKVSNN